MNWRRGLVFAGIHLAVSVMMFAWNEAPYWHLFRGAATSHDPLLRLAAWQEDQVVEFNPCAPGGFIDGEVSPMEWILGAQLGPVAFVGLGHTPCSSELPLDRMLESRFGARTKRSEAAVGVVTCFAIAVEWFLVGGLPLIRLRRWWLEPGALITACIVAATNMIVIAEALQLAGQAGADVSFGLVRVLCRVAALAALLVWLLWLGLLVWRLLRGGWRLITPRAGVRAA